MRPGDLIVYLFVGGIIVIICLFIALVFRKQKKLKWSIVIVVLVGYVSYYFLFDSIQAWQHERKYEQLVTYLKNTYPEEHFIVRNRQYEPGIYVGHFYVSNEKSPKLNVRLIVDNETSVKQSGHYFDTLYTKHNLWEELTMLYGGSYKRDYQLTDIQKVDEWIDGDTIIYALLIEGHPAIAHYTFANDNMRLHQLVENKEQPFVEAKVDRRHFLFVTDDYTEPFIEIETRQLKASAYKGRLVEL